MYKWLMRVGFMLTVGGMTYACGCPAPSCGGGGCSFGCPFGVKNILEAVVAGVLFD